MIMASPFFGNYRKRKSYTSAIAAIVSEINNRNQQVPGSLNCIYFLPIARIVVIK